VCMKKVRPQSFLKFSVSVCWCVCGKSFSQTKSLSSVNPAKVILCLIKIALLWSCFDRKYDRSCSCYVKSACKGTRVAIMCVCVGKKQCGLSHRAMLCE